MTLDSSSDEEVMLPPLFGILFLDIYRFVKQGRTFFQESTKLGRWIRLFLLFLAKRLRYDPEAMRAGEIEIDRLLQEP